MIESLRTKLLAERRRNLVQEMEIRKEMGDAMLQQLMESEELRTYVNLSFFFYLFIFFFPQSVCINASYEHSLSVVVSALTSPVCALNV